VCDGGGGDMQIAICNAVSEQIFLARNFAAIIREKNVTNASCQGLGH
jgi:hypothetical protein